jgi:hypothetical protein
LRLSSSKGDEGDGERAHNPGIRETLSTSARTLPSLEDPVDGPTHDDPAAIEWEAASDGRITIELKRGQYVRVDRGFDAKTLARVFDVLARRQAM